EVVRADARLPAGLELLRAVRRDERAAAVVVKYGSVRDPGERVVLRVIPERRLEDGGLREALRLDRLRALAGRDVEPLDREQVLLGDERVALGAGDRPARDREVALRHREELL